PISCMRSTAAMPSASSPDTGPERMTTSSNLAHSVTRLALLGALDDTLTAEDIEKYERHASENLTPDCAHWLAMGERRD
ncbi:MAG: hypothetical protein VCC36_02015, partial [Gammaproteobacteria bacterium]